MSRARQGLVLLALLLVLPLAAPATAQPPLPPNTLIPTQHDFQVGGLNVTTWVMGDTRTIVPQPGQAQNPLNYLWNLNFTAGAAGSLFSRVTVREPGAYQVRISIEPASPLFQIAAAEQNRTNLLNDRNCWAEGFRLACDVDSANSSVEHLLPFYLAASTPPGTFPVTVKVESWRNQSGNLSLEDQQRTTYDLKVRDPVPPFAAHTDLGDTTVYAWVNGGSLSFGGSGCLGGSSLIQDLNLSQGVPGSVCVLAITRSTTPLRLSAEGRGPAWMVFPPNNWTSQPFNATSGGAQAPVTALTFILGPSAPLGSNTGAVHFRLERQTGDGGWAPDGEGDVATQFVVGKPLATIKPPLGVNWLAQLPVLAVAAGGIGYLASKNRRPKIQPRSQAMRAEMAQKTRRSKPSEPDEAGGAGAAAVATTEQVAAQRQEIQEAAWEKKRKILEAKREDVIKSIRIAEERLQRGEITEHVFKGIRERKERQLEQVQKEMEDVHE